MKIVIPGGSGQVGTLLARHLTAAGHEVVVLSRSAGGGDTPWRLVAWDGKTVGDWAGEMDEADVVVNLAGRSVNCRYNAENRRQIMDSRVDSTRAVGEAIAAAAKPPRVWLQMSTATIYGHSLDRDQDEASGTTGAAADEPETWHFSYEVARRWEAAAEAFALPDTRRVLLRSTMVMSPDRGGVFDVMLGLVRRGLGGTNASGRQYISWIHGDDFCRAIDFLIERDDLAGPVNVGSPHPEPNRDFMHHLRQAWGTKIGLPATRLMLEVGAVFLRTETELILKSRRVVPGRLIEAEFEFEHPTWPEAAADLVARWRAGSGTMSP